ncbi:MAG TPA: FAD-dependent monooxygenase, partial [Phytomonospora sp.]
MLTSQVLIAGGGPTGLMLAGELRLAGVDVLVLERRPEAMQESRAGGIHARTMEIFDQRGILDGMLPEIRRMNAAHFSALRLDVSGLPTRYPFLAAILQHRIERHLGEWARGLGVRVLRDTEVVGLREDDTGV